MKNKKHILFPLGIVFLVTGVTLILVWWSDLVVLFRGAIGFVLALAGLLMMYSMNK